MECLRKLTLDGDNEALLLAFTDDLLEAITGLLCTQDNQEIDGTDDVDTDAEATREHPHKTRAAGESDVTELKGAALAILLNLAKYSSKTACRLPARPVLIRRLFGLLTDEVDEEKKEEQETEDKDEEIDVEGDEEEANVEGAAEGLDEADEPDAETEDSEVSGTEKKKRRANGKAEEDGSSGEEEPERKRQKTGGSDMEVDAERNGSETGGGGDTAHPSPPTKTSTDSVDAQVSQTRGEDESSAPAEAPTSREGGEDGEKERNAEKEAEGGAVDVQKEGNDGNVRTAEANVAAKTRERGTQEKMRKLAGLVLSKLADDTACCTALCAYDGLIVQAMLLALEQEQGKLASLMHKLLLNIGLAAS